MTGVVHLICASLRTDASPEAVAHAVSLAHALRDASGVQHVIVGRSPEALATVTWLADRDGLEPFAASPVHMAFIMRGLAPCVSGMWSAAVESDAPAPDDAGALWVFGLRDAETLFEWQVRDLLQSVGSLPGAAAAGPTIEERERYRAGGAVAVPASEIAVFEAALAAARRQWSELASALDHEFLAVIAPPAPGT
jgi:hypothetical protein